MTVSRLYKKTFFSNGIWVAPIGIKYAIFTGCGGGGGGGGGGGADQGTGYNDAGPGGGGQPALTTSQIVFVVPGQTYTITIGNGGAGGPGVGPITNLATEGNGVAGSNGTATTIIGNSVNISFPGGNGGQFGCVLNSSVNSFLQTFIASQAINGLNNRGNVGISPFPSGGRGGGAGGVSNNIYSFGGGGGSGSNDTNFTFNFFALPGGSGGTGGGGGGGGGGSCTGAWNNNHDGAAGGQGGSGFVEISWIQ